MQQEVKDTTVASGADLETEAMYKEVLDKVDAERARRNAEGEDDGDSDEEFFDLEELIANPVTYTWEDKYRPRKPRYFNRVHTGYEWNKYNQTHYEYVTLYLSVVWHLFCTAQTTDSFTSTDNPPPKVVQGYKFNIFYPDLIDKSVAPTYKIIREPGNDDTVLLRFSAGPPYEDIAFRVVNREWEFSHKRCV